MIKWVRRQVGRPLDRRVAGLQQRIESLHSRVSELGDLVAELAGSVQQGTASVHSRVSELADSTASLAGSVENVVGSVENVVGSVESLAGSVQQLHESLGVVQRSVDGEIHGMLRVLAAGHSQNRRALFELRRSDGYERPFSEEHPLVTIAIPTRPGREQLLIERALPSALAQSYEPLEVVIVSDAASAASQALRRLHDDRIRVYEQTHRVGHHDPWIHFLTGQMMPRNYAHTQARGAWVLDLDDDDALRPDAVASLLGLALERRAEVSYGLMEQHHPDGSVALLGSFPPASGDPDWRQHGLPFEPWDSGGGGCASLFHAGLAPIFAREYVATVLAVPGDYFRLERMVRAGVRFAMLDRVVYDYYPASLWEERT